MGGKSNAGSDSTTKKSFAPTTQNNPFYYSSTDKKGNTNVSFKDGTAGKTVYDFTNENLSSLLDSYLNPKMDDQYLDAYRRIHDNEMNRSFVNNVLNPLTANNMIRSSQATNMYNNLANESSNYADKLLLDWDSRMKDKINQLYDMYTGAYNGTADAQQTSINASLGGGTTKTKSTSSAG